VTSAPRIGRGSSEQSIVLPASLIIPTRNRPGMIVEAIRSVLDGDALPSEIVVVDQSDDESHCAFH
jgi:Glycosyl transferase family 2